MVTLFNADLKVEDFNGQCPRGVYDATRDFVERRGFTGQFRVNHYGLVRNGFDDRCDLDRMGVFCIHYREPNDDMTIREHYDLASLTTSSEDSVGMEALDLGKGVVERLERYDKISRILSQADYLGSSVPGTLGINTPAGRQSLHYHMDDNMHFGVLQLLKPLKERDYYCLDVLKNYLSDLSLYSFDIFNRLKFESKTLSFLQRLSLQTQDFVSRVATDSDLYHKLIFEPDKIKRIPFLLKHLSFFGVPSEPIKVLS